MVAMVYGVPPYLTNKFHFAVRLFSYRSQITSQYVKNENVANETQASWSLIFSLHFDVFSFSTPELLVFSFLAAKEKSSGVENGRLL